MPDISSLLEKSGKKKFKKSSYRPWNYMDEIQKEEQQEQQEKQQEQEISTSQISSQNIALTLTEPAQKIEVVNEVEPKISEPRKIEKPLSIVEVNKISIDINHDQKQQTNSPLFNIFRLSGHQKTIFNFILERCIARGLLSTGTVTSEMLTSITSTTLTMVNTSIQRLVEKGIVHRENGKRGRGGFYCFGISKEIKDAAVEYRRLANLDSLDPFKVTESQTQKFDVPMDDKKVTSGLPLEWDEIDIEPLSHIGFRKGHVLQLFKQGDIDVASLQDSIHYFSFDLKCNNKSAQITKTTPIAYFMGILKRTGLYNAPENYESPKDQALREFLARKKIEKEKRDHMMKELINLAFDDWQIHLSQEEKDKLIPEEVKKTKLSAAKIASLKTYFIEKVWPTVSPTVVK